MNKNRCGKYEIQIEFNTPQGMLRKEIRGITNYTLEYHENLIIINYTKIVPAMFYNEQPKTINCKLTISSNNLFSLEINACSECNAKC